MPVPDQRDPGVTSRALTGWLCERLGDAEDVAVTRLRKPSTSGFSNETLLFDAEWTQAGRRMREPLVARVAPTAYQLFPEPRFEDQHRLLGILSGRTDVPVPSVRWYEPGAALLGAPFLVMDHVAGEVPSDTPSYHQEGFLAEAAPEARARAWWLSLDVLARIHRLDVEALGLGFVDRPEFGKAGIGQQLGYYAHFLRWGSAGPQPVAEAALDWLRRERPVEEGPPRLLWGDSRIGNVIFQEFEPRAVLDWEMVTLGQPEVDLAWFLFMDRHHWQGFGVPRLAGLPGRAETSARYERLLRRPLRHLAYYEVFAAFRFAVIMGRLGRMFMDFEILPPDSDFPTNNSAVRLLAALLEECRC